MSNFQVVGVADEVTTQFRQILNQAGIPDLTTRSASPLLRHAEGAAVAAPGSGLRLRAVELFISARFN